MDMYTYLLYFTWFIDCKCAMEHSAVCRSILRQLSNATLNRYVFKVVLKEMAVVVERIMGGSEFQL